MTFREQYMNDEVPFDRIYDLTDEWNLSEDPRTLREYLGLTPKEEDVWISESDEALEELMEKEKKRWIFFLDLDDTLLDQKKNILPRSREILQQLLDEGHVAVICTGRALPSALTQSHRTGLDQKNCYIICYNGGQIYDITNKKTLYSDTIPMEIIRQCFDAGKEFGIQIQTYSDTHVLTEIETEDFPIYCQRQDLACELVDDVTKVLEHDPPKMLALDHDDHDHVAAFREFLQPKVEGKLDMFFSSDYYLEIVPPGINKGNAVRFLCNYLGIPLCHSIAMGDAENDITMLKAAGIGVAMINGTDAVKAAADRISDEDCNHDGAALMLEKIILKHS